MLCPGSGLHSSELRPAPSWGWATLFIHCLLRHSGGFHLLAAVNSIATNKVHGCLPEALLPLLWVHPQKWDCGS